MINAVTRNSTSYSSRAEHRRTGQADPLTAKRAAESRQLAIAAANQQQRAKVQQAVAAYMGLSVAPPLGDGGMSGVSLAQAQGAYGEF